MRRKDRTETTQMVLRETQILLPQRRERGLGKPRCQAIDVMFRESDDRQIHVGDKREYFLNGGVFLRRNAQEQDRPVTHLVLHISVANSTLQVGGFRIIGGIINQIHQKL